MVRKRAWLFLGDWAPVAACMAVIFYASSVSGPDLPALFPLQDILFHFGIYAILGLFFRRALVHTACHLTPTAALLITLAFGFGYGALDEFHQFFVAGRSTDVIDLLVDTAGSGLGGVISGRLLR